MKFTVTFDEGSWVFEVASTGDEDPYSEIFELTDIDEAKGAAEDLFDEILEICDPVEAALREAYGEDLI
jgi:hypothetical protein